MISRDWRYLLVAVLVVVLPLSGLLLLISSDRGQNTRTPATTPTTTSVTGSPAARPSPRKGPAELVHKVDTQDPVVFLTIDDGAHRDPAMIDLLRRHHIPATFFLTRSYADADPEFFERLRDETGGAIENHTATHANLLGQPIEVQRAEIGPVSDHFEDLFGQRPTLFRAPFGNSDATTLAAAGEAGARYVVHWGSTVNDGQIQFSGPHEFRPGSIVLMHFRPSFAQDIAAFLAQAQANGLTPALLTDYLK